MALQWWEYIVIALGLFFGCVFINFFVKKLNETRLEERLDRLQQKTSSNRSTQVQESSPMEPITVSDDQSQSANFTKQISFVYNKEENLNIKEKNTNSKSSLNSSKENSKLKFLGSVYKETNLPTKSNGNFKINSYGSHSKIKTKVNEMNCHLKVTDHSDIEIKSWINDLIINHIIGVTGEKKE